MPKPRASSGRARTSKSNAAARSARLTPELLIDTGPLVPEQVEQVARHGQKVRIGSEAMNAITAARTRLESVAGDGQPHYGINTGFGSFARQRISHKDLETLQRNLIRSHAAGVGTPLPDEIVRGMMLLLIGSLSRGVSGVRPVVVQTLAQMLNAGITPIVPETGSVGASGDLAPLAHVSLVLIGEGEAMVDGERMTGAAAMKACGVKPITLQAKEGLSLINGTHLMAAQGALFVQDFERLLEAALISAAMSIDACRATDTFLDDRIHHVREQLGQSVIAARLRSLVHGSRIIPSHRVDDPRVQDPYSFRCTPQVIGAVWDAFQYVRSVIDAELGAVTDNPLVFEPTPGRKGSGEILSGGNFHGMPLAIALDVAAICCAHVAGIAERRVYHMLSGFEPETGLPAFLAPKPGLNSGLMIAQYTAAACCNEIITLCTPASVSNISTSAGMEDYNSFGPRSAAKAQRALMLARNVIAVELLCGSEAIEHHRPLRSSPAVEMALRTIRERVPALKDDRPPSPDLAAISELIKTGCF